MGCVVLLFKLFLVQQYQLPVHQSYLRACLFESPQTSKIMWQYISLELTDGKVVRAGVSVTCNALS